MNTNYFNIEFSHLKDREIFPFHIYIYNPFIKHYSVLIYANSPLNDEKLNFLQYILSKGGVLAINRTQKNTFLRALAWSEDDIPTLKIKEPSSQERERDLLASKLREQDDKHPYIFRKEFQKACNSKDEKSFLPIILRVRDEILCFSLNQIPTTGMARELARYLLNDDTPSARVTAVSYYIARLMKIDHEKELSALVCASLIHRIAFTQLDLSFSRKALSQLPESEQNDWRKNPGITLHLIRKLNLPLDRQCLRIIEDSLERVDGNGYPTGKKGAFIDTLTNILGAVSHLFLFCEGKITGEKRPLERITKQMGKRTSMPGLSIHFSDPVLDVIGSLFPSDQSAAKAA